MAKNKKQSMVVEMPKMKPRLMMGSSTVPEIKDWQVGKEYMVKNLKVKQIGAHMDGEEVMGEFEVKGAMHSSHERKGYRSTSDGKMKRS